MLDSEDDRNGSDEVDEDGCINEPRNEPDDEELDDDESGAFTTDECDELRCSAPSFSSSPPTLPTLPRAPGGSIASFSSTTLLKDRNEPLLLLVTRPRDSGSVREADEEEAEACLWRSLICCCSCAMCAWAVCGSCTLCRLIIVAGLACSGGGECVGRSLRGCG